MPLVSICVPTYNGELFLKEALESIEAQTYDHCEVIVSDDASLDHTLDIVRTFAADSKYEYRIFDHEPAGIGSNWNHCIKQAEGKYIKFLFQDDVLYPECVSELVKPMEADSDLGMVFCRRDLLISQEPTAATVLYCYMNEAPTKRWEHLLSTAIEGKELLKLRGLLYAPQNKVGEPTSVMLRRSVFDHVGFFDADLKQTLDYEYWYRVFVHYKVCFIPLSLNSFRVHKEQATQQNKQAGILENIAHILTQRIDPSFLHPEVLARAAGKRTFFSMGYRCIFLCKKWSVALLVFLRIFKGRKFTTVPSE